ncbi:MAG: hypothetical protein M3N21_04615, partial [Actinomycetota bacterium]|nr:hypothetical protein [Actinomycetota bacterium]
MGVEGFVGMPVAGVGVAGQDGLVSHHDGAAGVDRVSARISKGVTRSTGAQGRRPHVLAEGHRGCALGAVRRAGHAAALIAADGQGGR